MRTGSSEAPLHGTIRAFFGPPTFPFARIAPSGSDSRQREAWPGDTRGQGGCAGGAIMLVTPSLGALRAGNGSALTLPSTFAFSSEFACTT